MSQDSALLRCLQGPVVADASSLHHPSWSWAPCHTGNRVDLVSCCKNMGKPCNKACHVKHYAPPNVSAARCPSLSTPFIQRGVKLRGASAPMHTFQRLQRRLACHSKANPIIVASIGGSVTAGPGGYSWAEYMRDDYWPAARVLRTTLLDTHVRFTKLATNAMWVDDTRIARILHVFERILCSELTLAHALCRGPDYMSVCFERHLSSFGGKPDVVFAEVCRLPSMRPFARHVKSLPPGPSPPRSRRKVAAAATP